MASSTVKATWRGPFTAELPEGNVEPGETAEIDRYTAESSAHWEVAPAKKKDSD